MKEQPLFTLVIPVFNVQAWLKEAVDSIVNQKGINFSDDVEVILVNDASEDDSRELCIRYSSQYENIHHIDNPKNMGLSHTRNVGIKAANGRYINFFDSDDILGENVLSEVKKFILNNRDRVAHISIPLKFFEAAKGLHPKYVLLGQKNRIVDIEQEPSNFILSSASSFYDLGVIRRNNIQFSTSLFGDEDTEFNFKIYSIVGYKFAYICENGVVYNYRRRKTQNSQVDKSRVKKEAFFTPIDLFRSIGEIKNKSIQDELYIYELRSRLKTIKPEIFDSEDEFYQIIDLYRSYINKISQKHIAKDSKFLDFTQKICFITSIYKNKLRITDDGYLLSEISSEKLIKVNDLPVSIKSIKVDNADLVIDVLLNYYSIDKLDLVLFDKQQKLKIQAVKSYKTDSAYINSVGSIKSSPDIIYYQFRIPVSLIGKYQFYFVNTRNKYLYIASRIETYSENPFLPASVFQSKAFKLYTNCGTSITFFNRSFFIEKTSFFAKSLNRLKACYVIYNKHKKFKWLRLLKMNKPKYWLFNDRPVNANDNAEALFEYINKNFPKLRKNCYFVLSKNSPDIERLSNIGNVVIQNTLKHKYLYLNSKYIFTSHLATAFFKPIKFKFLKYYNDLIDAKIIWLQHGITMNDIEYAANKFHKQIEKVVISAKFEEQIFGSKKYFFENEDIIRSGFARFDKLVNKSKRQILIMPTWRSYLSGRILANGMHARKEGFIDSDFYQNFSSLLSNTRLQGFLRSKKYQLVFVLHPGLRQYARDFNKFNNDVVSIYSKDSFSYTKLFNESSLMITDYSSVFFDFVYQNKPCIFFQFDKSDFFGKHYKQGLFNYEKMAPGVICETSDQVINHIIKLADEGFAMPEKDQKKLRELYFYSDRFSAHRILQEVLKNE